MNNTTLGSLSVCGVTTPLQRLERLSSYYGEPSSTSLKGTSDLLVDCKAGDEGDDDNDDNDSAVKQKSCQAISLANVSVNRNSDSSFLKMNSIANGGCIDDELLLNLGHSISSASSASTSSAFSGSSPSSASSSTTITAASTATAASALLSPTATDNNSNTNQNEIIGKLDNFFNTSSSKASVMSNNKPSPLVSMTVTTVQSGVAAAPATTVVEKRRMLGMYGNRRSCCCRLFYDLLLLTAVGLPIWCFSVWAEPYQRGFFCNDETLMHPYHESTVPGWMLYFVCFIIPITLMILIEYWNSRSYKVHNFDRISSNLSDGSYYLGHTLLPEWLIVTYKHVGLLLFGAAICQLTTDIGKYSIGRLRPHFFAVCQPLISDGSTCDSPHNDDRYIEEFRCSGGGGDYSSKLLKEVHLSFPSGHASFTCFTMLYIAIYLHKRLSGWRRLHLAKHLLQFVFIMFAWYTSLTRVSDYKHHWTDVLAGSLIGVSYAILLNIAV